MDLRTKFNIEPSRDKIGYNDRVLFIGSCFASEIGSKMEEGRLRAMINPSGSVYNPASVSNTIDTVISNKKFVIEDLFCHEGIYLSFYHSTDFSSGDPVRVLEKINERSVKAHRFLSDAKYLFITFGTARVYRWKANGIVVSNCHKIPQSLFNPELLTVNDIAGLWTRQLDTLHALFPGLKVVFTISPVRHWKDGAHGNQVSKSVLFLAVEELLKHPAAYSYFPAYELIMDDLRDYRYYADDMLHPSSTAIEYIWEAFAECFLEKKTLEIWKDVAKITRACSHQINMDSDAGVKRFAENMLIKISEVTVKEPAIDLSAERGYFASLLKI
ncbi:MAG TPA: GSCFA domain-containing protein [Bacteroidales bacterium]|nr:GSCFA domain-containing protein [Bacteroidales bacterium]